MAKKSNDDTRDKILWIAGGAAVTAFAMYYVNKHLNEREELRKLQFEEAQRQKALSGGGGGGE